MHSCLKIAAILYRSIEEICGSGTIEVEHLRAISSPSRTSYKPSTSQSKRSAATAATKALLPFTKKPWRTMPEISERFLIQPLLTQTSARVDSVNEEVPDRFGDFLGMCFQRKECRV